MGIKMETYMPLSVLYTYCSTLFTKHNAILHTATSGVLDILAYLPQNHGRYRLSRTKGK